MVVVKTKLDETLVAKIEMTGKSVYRFLQEAVSQKLQNDRVLEVESVIDYKLKEFEKRMIANVEDRVIDGIKASRAILEESIANDQKSDEEFRQKLNGAFSKILELLKENK